jgi:hypothetical protein
MASYGNRLRAGRREPSGSVAVPSVRREFRRRKDQGRRNDPKYVLLQKALWSIDGNTCGARANRRYLTLVRACISEVRLTAAATAISLVNSAGFGPKACPSNRPLQLDGYAQRHFCFVERFTEYFRTLIATKRQAFQRRNLFVRCGSRRVLLHHILNAEEEIVGTWIQPAHGSYPNIEYQRGASCYRNGNRPGVASVRRV